MTSTEAGCDFTLRRSTASLTYATYSTHIFALYWPVQLVLTGEQSDASCTGQPSI